MRGILIHNYFLKATSDSAVVQLFAPWSHKDNISSMNFNWAKACRKTIKFCYCLILDFLCLPQTVKTCILCLITVHLESIYSVSLFHILLHCSLVPNCIRSMSFSKIVLKNASIMTMWKKDSWVFSNVQNHKTTLCKYSQPLLWSSNFNYLHWLSSIYFYN